MCAYNDINSTDFAIKYLSVRCRNVIKLAYNVVEAVR